MKTIKKNVMILTLALFGLGIIGNNVLIGDVMYPAPPPGGGGGEDWKEHCNPVWHEAHCPVGDVIYTYMEPKD